MNQIKKYKIRSAVCVLLGMSIFLSGTALVAIFHETNVLSIPFSIIILGMLFLIPTIIYSRKATKIEIEQVKQMSDFQFRHWVDENSDKPDYVKYVIKEVGTYEQRWVKIGEDK
jgi:uncharacterized membrane protein